MINIGYLMPAYNGEQSPYRCPDFRLFHRRGEAGDNEIPVGKRNLLSPASPLHDNQPSSTS